MKYDDLISNITKNNKLNYIGNIILSNYEIEVLNKYQIDYRNCNSMKEIIFILDKYLNNEENEEIENILASISERDYYKNTNK